MTLVLPGPELRIYIRKELNENVDTRDNDLEHIKQWLSKQPHLPNTWDEQCLLNFLRGCNFSLEKCKRKLDMYFTMRTALPEFFTNRDVKSPEMRRLTKLGEGGPLPGLTPQGRRVNILRGLGKVIEIPNVADLMKLCLMIGDVRLQMEKYGVSGDVYILDATVLTANLFTKAANPVLFKKFFICLNEAYPVKVKEVHVINAIPLVNVAFNWTKPFLKEKVRNRVHVHTTLDTLYAFVPKDVLPEEYGGTAGKFSVFYNEWMKKLEEYEPWFKEQENLKSDESKRPEKLTNHDNLFGLEGSFRQLSID